MVLLALSMALTHRQPPAGLVLHSDRGVQYASLELRNALAAYSGGCRTLIPISVGQGSDLSRTLFQLVSDSVPG